MKLTTSRTSRQLAGTTQSSLLPWQSEAAIEIQPILTDDEYRFLKGDLGAAEYLRSAVGEERPPNGVNEDAGSRLGLITILSGSSFTVTSLLVLSKGSTTALAGLILSTIALIATQTVVEIRRHPSMWRRLSHKRM
jgi:hypothetical protein